MRILVICDSPYLYTGLARVNRQIIKGLSENGHEVFLGAWGWDQLAFPLNENNQWIYKAPSGAEYVAFPLSKDPKKLLIQAYEVLKSIPCDILLTIGDYWNFKGFEFLKSKLSYSYKWVAYYTIESTPINEDFVEAFNYMDEVISPSMFGKKVVEHSTDSVCHYVPYGIDHEIFSQIESEKRKDLRQKRDLDGKIRFINVSKNQHRKNIPAFLEALKLAHEQDEKIVGYLHTNVDKKVSNQVNVLNLIKRFEISDILSTPSKKISLDIGCSDEDLSLEYVCSDALVLSSVAEGFGFPILEAQSCGIPAIVSNCSSMPELCIYKELVVDCVKYYGPMEQEVGIVRAEDLAQKMLLFTKNQYDAEKMRKFTKGFSWRTTNRKIEEIIKGMNDRISIPVEEV